MKKKKKIWTRPALLLSLSAVLLLLSTVGSTRAALTYYSQDYAIDVQIQSIGVSLLENGTVVSSRDYLDQGTDGFVEGGSGELLKDRFGTGENQERLVPGKPYSEVLSVRNSGAIDEYVRVIVTRSWQKQNADGTWVKATDLDPSLIGLDLDWAEKNGWLRDSGAVGSDKERTVLYYSRPVAPGGETPAICSKLCLSGTLMDAYDTEETPAEGGTIITTTYRYNGYKFVLEAEVDAVQTHNAEDAIKSAWGVDVTIAPDKTLSLK